MTVKQKQIIKKVSEIINDNTFCDKCHIIRPSIEFQGTSDVSFFAYDDVGDIAHFYINFDKKLAHCQYVGLENTYDRHDISKWFFN